MGRQPGDPRWLLAIATTIAGVLGVVTVWVTLALWTDLACGWMALIAAVDHAVLLRLVRAPAGGPRVWLAVAATCATILAAAWLIVAGQLGAALGMQPLASALRLGPVLAWEYTRLGFGGWDWACVAFAPVLAVVLLQGDRRRTG
jgi:hypothetical protein